eukprot:2832869-Amphidinium_carterae.1
MDEPGRLGATAKDESVNLCVTVSKAYSSRRVARGGGHQDCVLRCCAGLSVGRSFLLTPEECAAQGQSWRMHKNLPSPSSESL